MKYNRIIIKLSGEALCGKREENKKISFGSVENIVGELKELKERNVKVGIVIGGGNFWRGRETSSYIDKGSYLSRTTSDIIGMLATVMNSLILKEYFVRSNMDAEVFSKLSIEGIVAKFDPISVKKYIDSGGIAIFAGGTGNPFVTTDTAAAIWAAEIEADVLLKATKVEGVYAADPKLLKKGELSKFKKITFSEAIRRNLGVMDLPALCICRENRIPVIVFNFFKKGNLLRVVEKGDIGTYIYES
jgi:uridylate kinase